MNAYDKTSIQINRCKRILALVDIYAEKQTDATRTDLRKALMEEFEAPSIAPPVAAGSVDAEEFRSLLSNLDVASEIPDNEEGYHKTREEFVAHLNAWGEQQREAGWVAGRRDQYQIAIDQRERAEKAEARVKELEADAMRWRHLRDLDHDLTGTPGEPCVALPNGMSSGYYLTGPEAVFAVDASMAEHLNAIDPSDTPC